MQPRLRSTALAAVCLWLAGCDAHGNTPGGGYAKILAEVATRECRAKASAPNAGNEAQLQQICDCTRDKIIAAKPGPLEAEESRRAKLTGALQACVEEASAASGG